SPPAPSTTTPSQGAPTISAPPVTSTSPEPVACAPEDRGKKPKPEKWAPTKNPNKKVIPGQMRSDCEEIPEGFTKEQADKAETLEAAALSNDPAPDGRPRLMVAPGCQVYWPAPYEVCGAIRDKYNELGGPNSFLLWPTSNELSNPDGVGKRSTFQNGPVYWSGATGAHPVVNSFLNRWAAHGYEGGWMRYPTTDEIVLPDGGRRQEFEAGAIYVAFQNAVGSAIRNGPLRDKYNSVGGLAPGGTLLGYPIQDQIGLPPDNLGQMARFQNGVIYWSPATGAHIVQGEILSRWADAGYEQGTFGYPVGEQANGPSNRYTQEFQRGTIEIYTLFTHQFKYEDTAGIIRLCVFAGRADRVHISTWAKIRPARRRQGMRGGWPSRTVSR
ncbi:LGFP repeat-containing protein, partial [Nocardia goodfellowii]